MLYLDNAATTRRKPAAVYAAMLRYQLFGGGNAGRGANKLSIGGVRAVLAAQAAAAELFGVEDESNVVFTQNATYALNIAILGTLSENDKIAVSAMDHNSILRPAALHGRYAVAQADREGYVSPLNFRRVVDCNTRLVACTHVSNVCGTEQPVEEIARLAHNSGAAFLLDASQSAGNRNIDMKSIGADLLACPGHKGLMGPMGTGILCIKDPDRLRAVIVGGTGSDSENLTQPSSMPDKFHSGTTNVPAIAGLTEAMRFIIKEGAENIGAHERGLALRLRDNLINMGAKVYGRADSGIVAFNFPEMDSADCAEALGANVIVRAGYHCAPLAHRALGTENGGAVRVSFGYFNKSRDVERISDIIYKKVKEK